MFRQSNPRETLSADLVICSGRQTCVDFANEPWSAGQRVTFISRFHLFHRGAIDIGLSTSALLVARKFSTSELPKPPVSEPVDKTQGGVDESIAVDVEEPSVLKLR